MRAVTAFSRRSARGPSCDAPLDQGIAKRKTLLLRGVYCENVRRSSVMAVSVSQTNEGSPPTDWRPYATLGPKAERMLRYLWREACEYRRRRRLCRLRMSRWLFGLAKPVRLSWNGVSWASRGLLVGWVERNE